MDDGTGLAEVLLGLDGFVVLAVTEAADELVVTVETKAGIVGCMRCGPELLSNRRSRTPSP